MAQQVLSPESLSSYHVAVANLLQVQANHCQNVVHVQNEKQLEKT